jgi:hypothetical protein
MRKRHNAFQVLSINPDKCASVTYPPSALTRGSRKVCFSETSLLHFKLRHYLVVRFDSPPASTH